MDKEKRDKIIRSIFQKPYDWFKGIKLPSFLVKITNFIYKYVSISNLAEIVKVAYEISKEVENDTVAGYIKKKKVVSGMQKMAKALGLELPTTLANLINECVAFYIKFSGKF